MSPRGVSCSPGVSHAPAPRPCPPRAPNTRNPPPKRRGAIRRVRSLQNDSTRGAVGHKRTYKTFQAWGSRVPHCIKVATTLSDTLFDVAVSAISVRHADHGQAILPGNTCHRFHCTAHVKRLKCAGQLLCGDVSYSHSRILFPSLRLPRWRALLISTVVATGHDSTRYPRSLPPPGGLTCVHAPASTGSPPGSQCPGVHGAPGWGQSPGYRFRRVQFVAPI